MADFSFIGPLQLHNHGALDSLDHWHCRALPLGCLSASVNGGNSTSTARAGCNISNAVWSHTIYLTEPLA